MQEHLVIDDVVEDGEEAGAVDEGLACVGCLFELDGSGVGVILF